MLKILYEDNFLVVAVKPSGLLSEGDGKDSFPSLLCAQLGNRAPEGLFTVHRLDRETEGIMVYALTSGIAAALSAQIQEDEWKKTYTAVLCGVPSEPRGRFCDLLYYDRARGKSFTVERKRKSVKEAVLDYSVLSLSADGKRCSVSVELQTGRTHQIRVQFASRGLPLCGDRRYGAPASSGKALALCATELCFRHPKSGERLEFKVDAPEFFETLLNENT